MNSKKDKTWSVIKRLFAIGMKFRTWFVVALIISVVLSVVSTYRPYLSMIIVDEDIIKLLHLKGDGKISQIEEHLQSIYQEIIV